MTKWQDYFKIVLVDEENGEFIYPEKYQLIISFSEEVVGTYKDYKYARKQAKYKFKKLQAKLEKILLA